MSYLSYFVILIRIIGLQASLVAVCWLLESFRKKKDQTKDVEGGPYKDIEKVYEYVSDNICYDLNDTTSVSD